MPYVVGDFTSVSACLTAVFTPELCLIFTCIRMLVAVSECKTIIESLPVDRTATHTTLSTASTERTKRRSSYSDL